MRFVIFLDVDGVLNTRTTVQRTPEGYRGIDDARVKVLADAIQKYGGADIVLTSDWKDMRPESEDLNYLRTKLARYGLAISDQTTDHGFKRGEGIQAYLDEHPDIEEYVILDDNTFDFKDYPRLWERFLTTGDIDRDHSRAKGIEHAKTASDAPAVEAIIFQGYIEEVS